MKSMFSIFRALVVLIVVGTLVACGGGGGSAGTSGSSSSSSSSGGASTTVSTGTVTLTLVDQNGAEVSGRTLSQTSQQFVKVIAKDGKGAVVSLAKVKLTADDTLAVVTPSGGLLTDTSGVALFRIAPANVSSSGVVTVVATATINSNDVTKNLDLQINPGTIAFSGISLNPTTLQRGQSLYVSASVLLNGVVASSNSVSVEFSTTCGGVTPTSALVDSNGKASAVVQTNVEGDCMVTATSSGKSISGKYIVTAPPVSGIKFVKAAPTTIYQTGSPGAKPSIVDFMVIDSTGNPVVGAAVSAVLSNLDGGINFCGSPTTVTSGSNGLVSFSVCAGTLPTNVQVKATLVSTPAIFTSSNILTVQTGLPNQRFFSMSASQFNFYVGAGFTDKFDGKTVDVNIYAADRQGNPVPDGTPITFVAEGGQINSGNLSSCIVKDGGCKVSFIGQDYRPWGSSAIGADPRPGRVSVLAYADGEEYFIDANNNNRYDSGELFEDLGVPYLEKNENQQFDGAYTNLSVGTNDGEVTYPIPASAIGTSACPTNSNIGLSVGGTCNGKWDGLTKVRASALFVFSGGFVCAPSAYDATIPAAKRTQVVGAPSKEYVQVQLADCNGNPLPADASIAVEVFQAAATPDGQCSATMGGSVIGSTTEPTQHGAVLTKCTGGETIQFKVTVTAGSGSKVSGFSVKVP